MPKPTVTVHVNRGSPETLETAAGTFETDQSFELILEGHDTPAHVHCRLVGPIEDVATLSQPNYYVEPGARTPVPIDVDAEAIDESIGGTLEVLTGYGSESVSIRIVVEPAPGPVDIDESLAKPNPNPNSNRNRNQNQNRTQTEPSTSPLFERIDTEIDLPPATLAALVAGLVIVVITALAAAVIGGSIAPIGLLFVVLVIAVLVVLYR